LEHLFFVHKLAKLDASEISTRLKAIQTKLTSAGVLVSLKKDEPKEALREIGKRFGSFGPPRPRNPASQNLENYSSLMVIKSPPDKAAVFSAPSLQTGFAAISLKGVPNESPLKMAEYVLCHRLRTGIIWDEIRIKGGAYGCSASASLEDGSFLFASYRDPNPLRTLEIFTSSISETSAETLDLDGKDLGGWNTLDMSVIGSFNELMNNPTDVLFQFLMGKKKRHLSRNLKDLLAVTPEKIDAVLKRLASEVCGPSNNTHPVIIAGKAVAEKAASQLGVELVNLP
jgi:Zn-dependent M16 (insulinase) family peptidase